MSDFITKYFPSQGYTGNKNPAARGRAAGYLSWFQDGIENEQARQECFNQEKRDDDHCPSANMVSCSTCRMQGGIEKK